MKFITIAAVSIDGVIGIDNEIPWHIPEDFKFFRKNTINNMLIVGYNTYLTLPKKAFDKREYIVLTGGKSFENKNNSVYQFKDFQTAYAMLKKSNIDKVFIIGGESIYDRLFNYSNEVIITWINKTYPNGNKRFPIERLSSDFELINDCGWNKSEIGISYKFCYYKRK